MTNMDTAAQAQTMRRRATFKGIGAIPKNTRNREHTRGLSPMDDEDVKSFLMTKWRVTSKSRGLYVQC